MEISNHNSQPLNQINVTPFVDVMLVLLVIFMVTAPLLQFGVEVNLPESTKQTLDIPKEQIVLTIQKDNTILVDTYRTSLEQLPEKLKVIYGNRTNKEIFVQADRQVPYGFVAKTMGVIKDAGVDQLGLITGTPEEGSGKDL
jgi:biopolymer transport protein TolR